MFKRIVLVFTFFLLLSLVYFKTVLADDLGVNLISNPSAEEVSSNAPKDWMRIKSGDNISVFNYPFSGHGGARSLYVNVIQYKTGYSAWYFKDVTVVPLKKYKYSEFYKSTMETEVFVRTTNTSNQTSLISLGKISPTSDWMEFSVEFNTSSDAKSLTIMHMTKSLGGLYTDDFSLVLVGDGGGPGPTLTPTPTITPTVTPTPANTPTSTVTPTSMPTATPTSMPTPMPTDVPSPTLTPTPSGNIIPNFSVETVSPTNSKLPQYWTKAKTGVNNAVFTYLGTDGHTG